MLEALWHWRDLVAAARGQADGAPTTPITGFSIDTRSLEPGDVFVALKDQRDGHEFVTAAFARGAGAALVSRDYTRKSGDGALLRVEKPLAALERIGRAARARLSPEARVIAVTGSAGKTGTKEMLRACLSSVAKTHAASQSFNNHWGVPLTLARMPTDTRFGVFEIGMNHAGEITPLTRMVRPHIAIITNVLPVHVGNFDSGEIGIAQAKAEIFAGLEPGGTAILLQTSPHFELLRREALARGANIVSFGEPGSSDAWIRTHGGVVDDPLAGQELGIQFKDGASTTLTLGARGSHIATNALAVVLALREVGLDPATVGRALSTVAASPGRGQRTLYQSDAGEILLIDESYNANPASMAAAIQTAAGARSATTSRLVLVLGDMLELGPQSPALHRALLDGIVMARADRVFTCGPQMRILHDTLKPGLGSWSATSGALIDPVLAEVRAGDIVMVKGSLGSRMRPIVDALKRRFAGPSPTD